MRGVVIRAIVAALALLGLAAFAIKWEALVLPGGVRETNDAQLQGDPTQLRARVAGYLAAVPATDYGAVRQGELLFAIDDRDYRARVARAEADVAAGEAAVAVGQAQLAQQQAQLGVATAEIHGAEADAIRAREERARQAALLHTESFLQRDWQAAIAGDEGQQARLAGTQKALVAQQLQLRVLQAQLEGQRATLASRRAALEFAQVELGYTRIMAPFDAVATARLVRTGDYVAANTALITVVPLHGVWVVANYREVQLTHMRPGQPASVTVDALPGIVLAGHVDSLQPDSQAQGSAMPPDRAAGNFTKIIQRVPVKVVLDPRPDLDGRLRPGLSAEVRVDTADVHVAGGP